MKTQTAQGEFADLNKKSKFERVSAPDKSLVGFAFMFRSQTLPVSQSASSEFRCGG
jgi:hypothetical protein